MADEETYDYQIGRFGFLWLDRPPEHPTHQVEIESYPGMDNCSLWDLGERGVPFQLRSLAPAASVGAAAQLLREYRKLIAGELVEVTWAGIEWPMVRYAVLDVQPVNVSGLILGKAAGITAFGSCRCAWTLIAMTLT